MMKNGVFIFLLFLGAWFAPIFAQQPPQGFPFPPLRFPPLFPGFGPSNPAPPSNNIPSFPFPFPWFGGVNPPNGAAPSPPTPPSPNLPGTPNPPGSSDDLIRQCWGSIQYVESCVQQIVGSFVMGNVTLSSSCCNAVSAVGQECVNNMLRVLDPFFPPLVIAHCTSVN